MFYILRLGKNTFVISDKSQNQNPMIFPVQSLCRIPESNVGIFTDDDRTTGRGFERIKGG